MLTLGKTRMKPPESFHIFMGDTVLERVSSIKYLGVILDDRFKWQNHISYVCTKISRSVGILSKLRYYVNIETLLKVYYSLVSSHLSYALIAWGSAGVTVLQPLKVLQNRAIRIISRAPRFRRLDNDYLNLRLLRLDDMHQHALAKFMHQYHNNTLPDYFSSFFEVTPNSHQYNLRQNRNNTYRVIDCRKVFTERSIRFTGPKLWGKVPASMKSLTKNKFKKEYSNSLLAAY
jgi:hypothetical protein